MKNIKDLTPHQICIRATKENAEFIIPLLEKLGGVNILHFESCKVVVKEVYYLNNLNEIHLDLKDEVPKGYTEITLEQLSELAGVKEPQTDELSKLKSENESLKSKILHYKSLAKSAEQILKQENADIDEVLDIVGLISGSVTLSDLEP